LKINDNTVTKCDDIFTHITLKYSKIDEETMKKKKVTSVIV